MSALSRFLLVSATLLLAASDLSAQRAVSAIHGRVVDSAGAPVAGVRVAIIELSRQHLTSSEGIFRFAEVPAGTYTLSLSRVGLAPQTRRVTVSLQDVQVAVSMRSALVEIASVQVTATPAASRAEDSPQPTAVLEAAELRRAQGAALGETLEQIPGVRSLSMTTGIGKPVIRGMTHYRVVTLDNGQRTETQAWGHDHSPNVETASAERVEVIKGPASVLYGSDALGGVVNVVAPPIPDAIDVPAFISGRLTSAYNHNIRGGDGTLLVEAARGGTGIRGALTMRQSGDMRTPSGTLGNTNNEATAGEVAVGQRGAWGSAHLRYAGRAERIEIFDDPARNPGYSGFQLIDTHRATAEVSTRVGDSRLQVNAGFEQNYRREFADASATEADLGLFVSNWTAFAHLHHRQVGPFTGTLGVSGMRSDFTNRGTQKLIPGSGTTNGAVYLFEQAERGRLKATFGARYDYRTLATDGDAAIGVTGQSRTFNAVTGSVGALYRVTEPVALVANVARGFRAPSAPDLFANGFHEGTRAFERGDPGLGVETSLNRELGMRVSSSRLTAEVTGFVNTVSDYIYLRPFGTGGGSFDSLQVVQGNARLAGFEARGAYRPISFLTLQASGDYVRGDNTSANVPLTFIPPFRMLLGVRFDARGEGSSIRSRYLAFSTETNARQTRIDPRDLSTPGYTLASVAAGFTRLVPRGAVTVDLSLRNAFNTEYRSFMSRYKAYASGPGRALSLKVSTSL